MTTLPKNHVKLYDKSEDIGISVPYATEDADALERVISRFVAWARMIPRYPDVAAKCGAAHIQLATDLRAAMKASRENRLYPNIVLPVSKYFSAKVLWVTSQSIGPEIAEMIEQENQRWVGECPA
jgi:hypothetical protein